MGEQEDVESADRVPKDMKEIKFMKRSISRKESWEERIRHASSEQAMRSIIREHGLVKFILQVIGSNRAKPDVEISEWLRDGSILMELMTTLDFYSVPKECFKAAGTNAEMERIQTVIETMRNYGVPKKFLFAIEDLYEEKDMEKVLRCIEEVEKLARKEDHIVFDITLNSSNKVYL